MSSDSETKQTGTSLPDRAFGRAAEEFSASADGAGAIMGEAAKHGAQALLTVAQALNAIVSPLKLLIAGEQVVREKFLPLVGERIARIPEQQRVSPPVMIAGPTIEAAKFVTDEPELAKMFANLLATAMDANTTRNAHPGFIETLKQLSPDEARILRSFVRVNEYPVIDIHSRNKNEGGYKVLFRNFSHVGRNAGVLHDNLTPAYLDNLCRLGVCEMPSATWISGADTYTSLESDPDVVEYKTRHDSASPDAPMTFARKMIFVTVYGRQFINACVQDRVAPPA